MEVFTETLLNILVGEPDYNSQSSTGVRNSSKHHANIIRYAQSEESESGKENDSAVHLPDSTQSTWKRADCSSKDESFIRSTNVNTVSEKLGSISDMRICT